MTDHSVVIAGGGPTGLMLAGELALAGVDVVIVERRTGHEMDGSRAGGLHSRTIEVLDQRGIAQRFLDAGQVMQVGGFAYIPLDISDFPTRHNYGLALWQSDFEPILAAWVAELGVPIVRGSEVVGCAQDDDGVDVELSDGTAVRARYLVGCDGGRSAVRKSAGIDFAGFDPTIIWTIAEVDMDDQPELGMRGRGGIGPVKRADGTAAYRVLLAHPFGEHTGDLTIDNLRQQLVETYGSDFGLRQAHWISTFTDMARQAVASRNGRVLLAGDAAHVHPPHGGQGLNTGVQDAVNLGWKLAQVVAGTSPDSLLDTYHGERHPVAARAIDNTMAQVALSTPDDRHRALHAITTALLQMDEPRRRIAGMMTGLDIHYDLGAAHPLVGRRMPDLDLVTAGGPTRVFALLHDARPILLNPGPQSGFDVTPWHRVQQVDATTDGPLELPVIGAVESVSALLIRPDGHVAWVGNLDDPALPIALTRWFGAPSR